MIKIRKVIGYKIVRPIFGSNWNNGVKCGVRGSNWNNPALNLNSNISGRTTVDTWGLTSWLCLLTRSSFLKRTNTQRGCLQVSKEIENLEAQF